MAWSQKVEEDFQIFHVSIWWTAQIFQNVIFNYKNHKLSLKKIEGLDDFKMPLEMVTKSVLLFVAKVETP